MQLNTQVPIATRKRIEIETTKTEKKNESKRKTVSKDNHGLSSIVEEQRPRESSREASGGAGNNYLASIAAC